jgi:hypothetical protein
MAIVRNAAVQKEKWQASRWLPRSESQGARSGIDPDSEMKMLETKRLCDCPQFLRILP